MKKVQDLKDLLARAEYERDRYKERAIYLTETLSEQKVGKWIYNADYSDRLICSECNAKFDMWKWEIKQMHFCPNCGARMESEDKNE